MTRLTVYPKPVIGESVEGYVGELAKLNGFRNSERMLKCYFEDAAVPANELTKTDIVRLTGHPLEIVDQIGLTKSDNHFQPHYFYYNLPIPSYHLRAEKFVCPACIDEGTHMDARWRIAWLPHCLKHGKLLVNTAKKPISRPITNNMLASNDDYYDDRILSIQKTLENSLDYESKLLVPLQSEGSVVSKINFHLKHAIGDGKFNRFDERRRKYSKRFFPLNVTDTIKFIECLHSQWSA